MRKKIVLLCIIVALFSVIAGFTLSAKTSSSVEHTGGDLFVKIKNDNAKILTTSSGNYHYYYLKDTKIVYVGYLGVLTLGSSQDCIAPVVSANGHYYRYNVDDQMVEEVKD